MCRVLRKNGVLFAIERSPDNVDGLTTEGDNKLTNIIRPYDLKIPPKLILNTS